MFWSNVVNLFPVLRIRNLKKKNENRSPKSNQKRYKCIKVPKTIQTTHSKQRNKIHYKIINACKQMNGHRVEQINTIILNQMMPKMRTIVFLLISACLEKTTKLFLFLSVDMK